MTHPTLAIFQLMVQDFLKVEASALYTLEDMQNCAQKIEKINFHEEIEVEGIKFWCYNAGHVLGGAMVMCDIDGTRVLYTGDFSRQEDRHLMKAEIPSISPDVVICESTFGRLVEEPREVRERRFVTAVHEIVGKRGGNCLMPVFALGRVQELLLILDSYWQEHPELQHVPIYYASMMSRTSMEIYSSFIFMMNEQIRQQLTVGNPFDFKYVRALEDRRTPEGPCVVLATPGMMQGGLSRQLFEEWCEDKRNGFIAPGYVIDGTLLMDVLKHPDFVATASGGTKQLRMSVEAVSFSAHADFAQTSDFLSQLEPQHLVLVHGRAREMFRMRQALLETYGDKISSIATPRNCDTVQISFKSEKIAKTVGALAGTAPVDGDVVSGVLVSRHFTHQIMASGDLRAYTQLQTTAVRQRVQVPYYQPFEAARKALEYLFAPVVEVERALGEAKRKKDVEHEEDDDDSDAEQEVEMRRALCVRDTVYVIHVSDTELRVEWNANPVADMIVDGVVAALVSARSPAQSPLLQSSSPSSKTVDNSRAAVAQRILANVYDSVAIDESNETISLRCGELSATIAVADGTVTIVEENHDSAAALKRKLNELWERIHF